MEIYKQALGIYKANCYVLKEEGQCLIIDPGLYADKVKLMIGTAKPLAILLTHCHVDHCCAVNDLLKIYDIPVYMNPKDEELLQWHRRVLSIYRPFLFRGPYEPITEGTLQIGPFTVRTYEMPGHTQGSVMYQIENHLFTGDTLFKGKVGITHKDNGNHDDLRRSAERLKDLDPDLIVNPGHAEDTTVGEELAHNERLQKLFEENEKLGLTLD